MVFLTMFITIWVCSDSQKLYRNSISHSLVNGIKVYSEMATVISSRALPNDCQYMSILMQAHWSMNQGHCTSARLSAKEQYRKLIVDTESVILFSYKTTFLTIDLPDLLLITSF